MKSVQEKQARTAILFATTVGTLFAVQESSESMLIQNMPWRKQLIKPGDRYSGPLCVFAQYEQSGSAKPQKVQQKLSSYQLHFLCHIQI